MIERRGDPAKTRAQIQRNPPPDRDEQSYIERLLERLVRIQALNYHTGSIFGGSPTTGGGSDDTYVTKNRVVLVTVHNPDLNNSATLVLGEGKSSTPVFGSVIPPGEVLGGLHFEFANGIYVQQATGLVTVTYQDQF